LRLEVDSEGGPHVLKEDPYVSSYEPGQKGVLRFGPTDVQRTSERSTESSAEGGYKYFKLGLKKKNREEFDYKKKYVVKIISRANRSVATRRLGADGAQ
jgi:hypothetical protein